MIMRCRLFLYALIVLTTSCLPDLEDKDDSGLGTPEADADTDADADGDTDADADSDADTDTTPDDADGDGFTVNDGDCDDGDATIHPEAEEYCNGVDDDCDDVVDEDDAVDASTWYLDYDSDGFGGAAYMLVQCDQPSGYADNDEDCDDVRADVFPGADEACDGADNDCDGEVDEAPAVDAPTWYADADGDGYGDGAAPLTGECELPEGYSEYDTDCDDSDSTAFSDADEYCDGHDDDCDGDVDEDDAVDASIWYADADSDSYGDPSASTTACSEPSGFVADDSDCDDGDAAISPSESESCNGVDDDCSGYIDDGAAGCPYDVHYCDEGASVSFGSAYMFAADQPDFTWTDAEAACEDYGYQLVKVEDEYEWDWIADVIDNNYSLHSEYIDDYWWIGLNCSTYGSCATMSYWSWPDGSTGGYWPSWCSGTNCYPTGDRQYAATMRYSMSPYTLKIWSTTSAYNFNDFVCKVY